MLITADAAVGGLPLAVRGFIPVRDDGSDGNSMIGKRRWAIPEGYIPDGSHGPDPEMTSHETVCVLNTSEEPASVELTVYFADRNPAGPYRETVPAERTRHFRFNDFEDPAPIPTGTPFASVLEADIPVVCQHTRLDSRQAENALLSTVAYPGDG